MNKKKQGVSDKWRRKTTSAASAIEMYLMTFSLLLDLEPPSRVIEDHLNVRELGSILDHDTVINSSTAPYLV